MTNNCLFLLNFFKQRVDRILFILVSNLSHNLFIGQRKVSLEYCVIRCSELIIVVCIITMHQ